MKRNLLPLLLAGSLLTGCAVSVPSATTPTSVVTPDVEVTAPNPETEVTATEPEVPAPPTEAEETAGGALAALATLEVKGRAPRTGYDRSLFGEPWADVDGNGCDTRNDMLARDLTDVATRDGCVVLSGILEDPYSGKTIEFFRDGASGAPDTNGDGKPGDSRAVQLDHLVSLSGSWQTGAQSWGASKRLAFANDPLNLVSADGPLNMQKGDSDAASWLPPNKSHRCQYVAGQMAVKAKYQLWVTAAERDAITRVLESCPDQELPSGGLDPDSVVAPDVEEPVTEAPTPVAPDRGGIDPDYGSCRQAKEAGAGPYVRDVDPEYDFYRDADADGTVCE